MSMYTHVELHSQDPAAAKAFYSGVFGWTYSEMPMPGGTYVMVANAKGEPIGGMTQAQDKSAPDNWIGYVTVDSVKAAVAKAAELGANIVVDFTEIPGMGAFAILTDPRGGLFGVWQDAAGAKPAAEEKPAKKKVAKKAAKKKVAKKAAKKKVAKKAAKKKVAKKAAKKAAKKKVAKKAAKKKVAKKAAKKKVAKKAAKKKVAKKAAKKKVAKKKVAKKAAKKKK